MLTTEVYLINAAYAIVFACMLVLCSLPMLGILQQEGYSCRAYLRWHYRRANMFLWRHAIFACSLLLLVTLSSICFSFAGPFYANLAGAVAFTATCALFVYAFGKALKVPLRRTRRLVRLAVCHFLLLFAIIFGCGIGFHCAAEAIGHDLARIFRLVPLAFLPLALPLLLVLANLVMKIYENPRNKNLIWRAKRKLAACDCVKVGITGSFAKTSVKRAAEEILSAKFRVIATPSSYNTPIGIARCINENGLDCDIFLAEMGARYEGDIAELCDLVHPAVGIVTGVCAQHLSTFGSLEKIRAEKGILAARAERTVLGESAAAFAKEGSLVEGRDFAAEDIALSTEGTRFTLRLDGKKFPVSTPILGRHAAEDIALAAALSLMLGMTAEEIADAVKNVSPVPHRLQKLTENGVNILDDSYNSNVLGARDAVETLGLFGGRKYVVTPGLVELGDIEREENEKLGASFAGLDEVILVGETLVLPVRNGYLAAGGDAAHVRVVPDLKAAQKLLAEELAEGDSVLFLNDLPDKYL